MLVYDITNRDSFENVNGWFNDLKRRFEEFKESFPQFIIVGNKSDLDSTRKVQLDELEQYSNMIGATYVEISAKNGRNIDELRKILLKQATIKINEIKSKN